MINACRNKGYTLIEVVTVLPAISVIMLVATSWIHYTLKFANEIKQQRNHHKSVTRLIWDLREEISHGQGVEVSENSLMVTHRSGVESTYEVTDDKINFTQHKGKELIRQEVYQLAPHSRISWEIDASQQEVRLAVYRGDPILGKDKELQSRLNKIDVETSFRISRWLRSGEANE